MLCRLMFSSLMLQLLPLFLVRMMFSSSFYAVASPISASTSTSVAMDAVGGTIASRFESDIGFRVFLTAAI